MSNEPNYRVLFNELHEAIDLMLSLLDEDKPASAARVGQTALGRIGND